MGSGPSALVVCDDERCVTAAVLEAEQWIVDQVAVAGAVAQLDHVGPDVVVIHVHDVMQRADVCAALRSRTRVPMMVVSAQSSECDVVAGLGAGADAFVLESIGPRELLARVRALLRRTPPPNARALQEVLQVGSVVLDVVARTLTVAGSPLALPRREFDILELLMRDAGRVVTRADLCRRLGSAGVHAIDVQTRRLRARLATQEGCTRIVTVRGVGYLLATEAVVAYPVVESTGAASSDPSRPLALGGCSVG